MNTKSIMGHSGKQRKRSVGKVAYLLDSFPNVSETFVINEIDSLIKQGWDVHIFSLHRPLNKVVHPVAKNLSDITTYIPRPAPLRLIGWELIRLATRKPIRLIKTLQLAYSLPTNHYRWTAKQAAVTANEIMAKKCDRLHVHFASEASRFGLIASKYIGIPLTVTVHSPCGSNESERGTIDVLGIHAEAIFTVSEFNKMHITREFSVPAEKIYVNPNGIPSEMFAPSSSVARVPGRILTVARLHPDKGVRYAIEAANELKRRNIDFQWHIIGDGPERELIETLIKKYNLENSVLILGYQTNEFVADALRSCEIFVLPSVSESQGVVYLEAMATGTPVVGTDVQGVAETVIDGQTGYLVPPRAPDLIADKLQKLLGDGDLRLRFGKEGIKRVKQQYRLSKRVKFLSDSWIRIAMSGY